MPSVLILGAKGQVARNTLPFFLKHTDVRLTLYLRRADIGSEIMIRAASQ